MGLGDIVGFGDIMTSLCLQVVEREGLQTSGSTLSNGCGFRKCQTAGSASCRKVIGTSETVVEELKEVIFRRHQASETKA